jgi:acetylornithine deacetylase
VTPDPFELLRHLVAIPSPSGQEAEMASFVLAWARSHGLDAEPVGRNVVARLGRSGGQRLLYNSHLDTVAPVAGWPHDPFTPLVDGDCLSGLGANDAKGCPSTARWCWR